MLGVDEAGRGPLAGPVAVGVVAVPDGFDVTSEFPNVRDSKLLTSQRREELFELLDERAAQGDLRYTVQFENAEIIDMKGIVTAVERALHRGVDALVRKECRASAEWGCTTLPEFQILLDGLLHAPPQYAQITIEGGDELVPLISLASIAAKVSRDRLMNQLAREYPAYGFDQHKGYGTAEHYLAIREYGPCVIHRRSFLHLIP